MSQKTSAIEFLQSTITIAQTKAMTEANETLAYACKNGFQSFYESGLLTRPKKSTTKTTDIKKELMLEAQAALTRGESLDHWAKKLGIKREALCRWMTRNGGYGGATILENKGQREMEEGMRLINVEGMNRAEAARVIGTSSQRLSWLFTKNSLTYNKDTLKVTKLCKK
jgi:hypothetical protein